MAIVEDKFLKVEKSQSEVLKVRYSVIHGNDDGPKVFVIAGIHGHELNGVEVIRRLKPYLEKRNINGMVTILPVANPVGFSTRQRNTIYDNKDLNRCFPGNPEGTFTHKLAHEIFNGIVAGCDCGIDLHTGPEGRVLLPHTRIRKTNKINQVKVLSKVFGTLIAMSPDGEDTMLTSCATSHGIPTVGVELGEAYKIDEYFVKAGFFGVVNTLRYLEVLKGKANVLDRQFILNERHDVKAQHSGLFYPKVKLGQVIKKGDLLGELYNIESDTTESIYAERKGIVLARFSQSVVLPDTTIMSILTLDDCALNNVALKTGRYIINHYKNPTNIWSSFEY
ncbi:MAG: succinylglutamate desuccinylase/aspartoacylase family protein [archaeon]